MPFALRHALPIGTIIVVFCLDYALCPRSANGQDVDSVESEAVLKRLRSGQPELALEATGKLVDEPLSHSLPTDDRTKQSLIGEEVIANNVLAVRREAASMTAEQRYEFLCRWILPSKHHANFRMTGSYLPANMPPPVQEDPAFRSSVSGVVSPVFDLLETAKVLSKLSDLRRRVESAKPEDSDDLNASHALLALIDFELNQPANAEASINHLITLPSIDDDSITPIWPALLVVHRRVNELPATQAVFDLIASLHSTYVADGDSRLPLACLRDIQFLSACLHDRRRAMPADDDDISTLDQWHSVSPATASVRGDGAVTAQWKRDQLESVAHLCGPDVDYLTFVSPLQGNYRIAAKLSTYQLGQVLNAGRFVGRDYQLDHIQTGELGGSLERIPVTKTFEKSGPWVNYRAEISESNERVFLNGRLVHERTLDAGSAPWLAFRSWYKSTAQFRDVKIEGTPKVLEQVSLSSSPELSGWNDYFSGSLQSSDDSWKSFQEASGEIGIIGSARPDLPESYYERLARYFRPLVEDSSVEYEFYYDSNVVCASPVLDRLAFVLTPQGVAEHWVTDGRFDRTQLRPDNLQLIHENQRHDGDLPLRESAWNQVRVEVQGNELRLRLNDQLVYEREINVNNDRTFGLFHFADQGEIRVRRIILEGDWPKKLPDFQQLADPLPYRLDESLAELKTVFTHAFDDVNETARYFNAETLRQNGDTIQSSEGLAMFATSRGPWKQVAATPQFAIRGDFDVTASVSNVQLPESADMARIALMVSLDDDFQRKLLTAFASTSKQGTHVMGSINLTYPDGTAAFMTDRQTDESTSGRLRVARRGEQVAFLFAPGDTNLWQVIHRETASTADVPVGGIQLLCISKGAGTTSAVWKDITIRAEEMMVASQTEAVSTLSIFPIDFPIGGSEIRELAASSKQMPHIGSPAWSPVGNRIAYDQHSGGTTTSRLMVVDRSGGEPVDIGFGSMPTFSPDGMQIAFSAAGEGVGIANVDGSNRRILDRNGWGIQWSPVGNRLAYSKGGNLYLWDLKQSTSTAILEGANASRYSYIYWNMCWSPSARQIALKGRRRDGSGDEIAVVRLSNPVDLKVLVPNLKYGGGDLAWSPDGQRLVVPTLGGNAKESQLYEIDLNTGGLVLLPNQPSDRTILTAAWSPDGRSLAICGKSAPKQIPWVSNDPL
ncbi:DUF1583 domain-containing protein [Neorhodopirellula pilleata]|nr:DUF1583 domain-containing protein [Neorhodopirellula pilleata]